MKTIKSKCFVCGAAGMFIAAEKMTLLREAKCSSCGASLRYSDVAHNMVKTFTGEDDRSLYEARGSLHNLRIFEAGATGRIHEILKGLPHYVCAEYFDDVPPGQIKDGVRCEDLTRLTFADNSFDLVVTQDVLEHVSDPETAFREIRRITKPGGYHIFTVPLHEGRSTVVRAEEAMGKIRHLLPAVYHGDPLRPEGALVFTDFGDDLCLHLNSMGMHSMSIKSFSWYLPDELSFVHSGNYPRYLDAYKSGQLAAYFKYNSIVFISKKICLSFTGERFVPEVQGIIAYEHLHRYAMACDYAEGKTVLDIASGEGYGSSLLANKAAKVMGIDVSDESVSHARIKYSGQENLEFLRGSAAHIPCDADTFDLVVSFETIEHLTEQDRMLDEIKRVLKRDGLLIISSPNKDIYGKFSNYYHEQELTLDEFIALLNSRFEHLSLMGQRLTFSSHIWQLEKKTAGPDFVHYSGDTIDLRASTVPPFGALYYIAFCTNAADAALDGRSSLFTNTGDFLYQDYTQTIPSLLNDKDKQILGYKDSFSWKITAPLRFIARFIAKKNHGNSCVIQ